MAKTSVIHRNIRRGETVARYKTKREALKEKAVDIHLSFEERMEAQQKLQALPKNASPVRRQRRCSLCGRPRGVFRKFGLCRIHLRELAMDGKIPGIRKASW